MTPSLAMTPSATTIRIPVTGMTCAASSKGLAEEAPLAYKDVDAVVRAVEDAGLAGRVARLRPIGVVKG